MLPLPSVVARRHPPPTPAHDPLPIVPARESAMERGREGERESITDQPSLIHHQPPPIIHSPSSDRPAPILLRPPPIAYHPSPIAHRPKR